MSPKARSSDLLYLSTGVDGAIYVYTYPKGQLVGGLLNSGKSYGLCSDANGDVFVTNDNAIYEYPHGSASGSAALTSPFGGTVACSVDSTTGNLAAVAYKGVVIFRPQSRHGWKLGELISISNSRQIGYDASGNLFLDGLSGTGNFVAELPKGKADFKNILINKRFPLENIQWDGKHVTIGDGLDSAIHRFKFVGPTGRQIGVTKLNDIGQVSQFWIQGATVSVAGAESGRWVVGLWPYPAGGNSQAVISQNRTYGVTVSVAPSSR